MKTEKQMDKYFPYKQIEQAVISYGKKESGLKETMFVITGFIKDLLDKINEQMFQM